MGRGEGDILQERFAVRHRAVDLVHGVFGDGVGEVEVRRLDLDE